ncbi:hypothetical protein N7495_007387, partial [Penicillium taxi]|uniref:uncharacterized protein n=1 Tax=Penicillium taxi TaxID=168475 RepID=UPI002544F12B
MHYPFPLEGRSLIFFILSIVLLIACVITVSLRCFVRGYVIQSFGWDDSLMIAGLVCFICEATCLLGASTRGLGHGIEEFQDLSLYRDATMWWWISSQFYAVSSGFAKGSIVMTLIRLSVKRTHHYILWAVTALILISSLLFLFTWIFVCWPISYYWNRVLPDSSGHCTNSNAVLSIGYIYTVLSLLIDLTLGVLPIFMVYKLQMNTPTKVATGAILSLDALFQVIICTTVEAASAVIAGSLITLRPLFRWVLGPETTSGKEKKNGYKSDSYSRMGYIPPKGSHPGNWRPDYEYSERVLMTEVTATPKHSRDVFGRDGNSSEEHLNPIGISRTFNIEETVSIISA